jgi:hypothetical protein
MQYEKLNLETLKILYDEYLNMERNKRKELHIITAEIEIIEAFIDHTSKCIYRVEQLNDKKDEI